MEMIIVVTIALLAVVFVWLVIAHRKDVHKDKRIMDEYLETRQKVRFSRGARTARVLKKTIR